ncbi:MAG TPA: hypothetical protein VFQ76_02710 [Longimicrobiaceae bacterium]|nr:hypothetical protein [Longimicrobiaceae bacterium]
MQMSLRKGRPDKKTGASAAGAPKGSGAASRQRAVASKAAVERAGDVKVKESATPARSSLSPAGGKSVKPRAAAAQVVRPVAQPLAGSRKGVEKTSSEERARRVWQIVVQNHLNTILLVLKPVVVAQLLAVSPAQVTRWRQNQVPDAGTRDRLRRLSDTVSLLLQRFQPKAASDWLHAPNIHEMDGGGTPADLIRQGKWEVLRPYVEEAVSEAYG